MAAKNRTTTQKAELVETGNIHLALKRVSKIAGSTAARRALYHGIQMAGVLGDFQEYAKLREVLRLP